MPHIRPYGGTYAVIAFEDRLTNGTDVYSNDLVDNLCTFSSSDYITYNISNTAGAGGTTNLTGCSKAIELDS